MMIRKPRNFREWCEAIFELICIFLCAVAIIFLFAFALGGIVWVG